jgi:hypothetical protein
MAKLLETGTPKLVNDLADAFNRQSKQSNQFWLALVVASAVALFPEQTTSGNVKLPFSLGEVRTDIHSLVGFFIVTILMIAYCRAFAEGHLVRKLFDDMFERIETIERRDAFRFRDALVISNFARVFPLVDLAATPQLQPVYYWLLKLTAVAVTFGIPSSALVAAYVQVANNQSVATWLQVLAFAAMTVTSIATIHVLTIEMRHSRRVASDHLVVDRSRNKKSKRSRAK